MKHPSASCRKHTFSASFSSSLPHSYSHAMTLETIQLEHVPATHSVHVSLFRDVANADFLQRQLLGRNQDFEYAFIDATSVCVVVFLYLGVQPIPLPGSTYPLTPARHVGSGPSAPLPHVLLPLPLAVAVADNACLGNIPPAGVVGRLQGHHCTVRGHHEDLQYTLRNRLLFEPDQQRKSILISLCSVLLLLHWDCQWVMGSIHPPSRTHITGVWAPCASPSPSSPTHLSPTTQCNPLDTPGDNGRVYCYLLFPWFTALTGRVDSRSVSAIRHNV